MWISLISIIVFYNLFSYLLLPAWQSLTFAINNTEHILHKYDLALVARAIWVVGLRRRRRWQVRAVVTRYGMSRAALLRTLNQQESCRGISNPRPCIQLQCRTLHICTHHHISNRLSSSNVPFDSWRAGKHCKWIHTSRSNVPFDSGQKPTSQVMGRRKTL